MQAEAALTRKGFATRQALLDSTIELIASRGYAATTTQAVLDHSGLSRGSLLHQFRTRELLMVAAAEEALLRMLHASEAGLEGYDDPVQALYAYPGVIWTVQNEVPARAFAEMLLASRWETGLRDGLRKAVNDMNAHIAGNVREFTRAHGLSDADRLIAETHALISATQSLAVSGSLLQDEQRIQKILDVLASHYHACLADMFGRS